MDRDPYAAPRSNVRDVSPEAATHWIRTKWLYLSLVALQALLARRSGSSPWWWDALFFCLIGTAVLGALVDDPILIVVGFLPSLVLITVVVLGTWVIEARQSVRIYSKARGLVFVDTDHGR